LIVYEKKFYYNDIFYVHDDQKLQVLYRKKEPAFSLMYTKPHDFQSKRPAIPHKINAIGLDPVSTLTAFAAAAVELEDTVAVVDVATVIDVVAEDVVRVGLTNPVPFVVAIPSPVPADGAAVVIILEVFVRAVRL